MLRIVDVMGAMVTECNIAIADSRVRISTGRFLSGALNAYQRTSPRFTMRPPVLFAEPDVELAWRDWLARVALNVTDLVPANSLSPDLCLECVANERRSAGLSSPAQLVDQLQEPLVDGHLDRLYHCGVRYGRQSTSYTTSEGERSIAAHGANDRAHNAGVEGSSPSLSTRSATCALLLRRAAAGQSADEPDRNAGAHAPEEPGFARDGPVRWMLHLARRRAAAHRHGGTYR